MAIARSIEAETSNWTNVGGVLKLSLGHTDSNPSTPCDGTVEIVKTNCSTNDTSVLQKRTYMLGSLETIWDISGNVWEWIDWQVETPNLNFTPGPQTCLYNSSIGWEEIQNIILRCNPALGSPAGSTLASPLNTSLAGTNNIGRGQGGSGGAVTRGGGFSSGAPAGVYALNLETTINDTNTSVGFRCVYRP
jgi:formylglycine-generating enzyme required for sulfatase activity